MEEVLCQDCLKVKPFTAERHEGIENCECGGDLCGCGSCTDTIAILKTGKLKKKHTGLTQDLEKWSAKNGVY